MIIRLEHAMLAVKAAMQKRGLNVNMDKLQGSINKITQEKAELERSLRESLGLKEKVNFNSSKDVAIILSSAMGIKLMQNRSGRFIANRKVLRSFNNPLTEDIAQYRYLEKLLSSLRGFYDATDKLQSRLFCIYTDDCPSGRLYTKDYNIQGISELGRTAIYPDKGCSFILADYNSFELRILSALAHDKYFKDCWAKGLDLHKKVISDMKGIAYAAVTDKERKLGKILNFGLAYGQEAAGLAKNLGVAIKDAQKLMASYKERIPEIEAFKLKVIEKVRITGYTETHFGRRRFLPDILSPNVGLRKKAERRVINTKIQGTGADIVKFALVDLHSKGFIIDAMVHDGILLTASDTKIELSLSQIKKTMEIEIEGMKFTVSCKVGKTWADCAERKI